MLTTRLFIRAFLRFPASPDYIITQLRVRCARGLFCLLVKRVFQVAAMYFFMAFLAKRNSIRYVATQFRIIAPLLNVVGVKAVIRPAFNTFAPVTVLDRFYPHLRWIPAPIRIATLYPAAPIRVSRPKEHTVLCPRHLFTNFRAIVALMAPFGTSRARLNPVAL